MNDDRVPLVARHPDGRPRVVAMGRLSKPKPTEGETQENLESSLAVVKQHLKHIYDGELVLATLAEQISGQIADRATMQIVEEMISAGEVDVVVAEDLSKFYRNPRLQYDFVENAVDSGVRVIAVADRLDTSQEDWELMMSVATLRHGMTIPDARRRVKRKATFGFENGGNVPQIRYGYRKVSREDARAGKFGPDGLRVAKLPEATPVLHTMREILMTEGLRQLSYGPVLDWLVNHNVPPGPYVKSRKWTRRVIKDLLTDPILKGVRRFRRMLSIRVRKTGKFRQEVNPKGPLTKYYDELRHFTDEEFDSMQEVIEAIGQPRRRKAGPQHPLYRKRRTDSIFPQLHATCAICGGLMYAYDVDEVKCQNAVRGCEQPCWNHVQVDCTIVRERVVPWLLVQGNAIPGFRQALLMFARREMQEFHRQQQSKGSSRSYRIAELEKQAKNYAEAIANAPDIAVIVEQSRIVNDELQLLRREVAAERRDSDARIADYSPEELDSRLERVLVCLAGHSHAFADLMREILPRFEIFPVQLIGTNYVRPRARLTLRVTNLLKGDGGCQEAPEDDMSTDLDLFDRPKHIRFMDACRDRKRENPKWSYERIAAHINSSQSPEDPETISYMTVKRAFADIRLIEAEGLQEPYRELTERPAKVSRWTPRR